MNDMDPELKKLLDDIDSASDGMSTTDPEHDDVDLSGVLGDVKNNINLDDDSDKAAAVVGETDTSDFDRELEEDEYDEKEEVVSANVEIDNTNNEIAKAVQDRLYNLLDRHCEVVGKMFEEADVDRKKVDDILDIILPKIRGSGDDYKAADVQSAAVLMQTKVDISKNRASLMDSISRLFGALKNNDSIRKGEDGENDLSEEEVRRLLK